jgi:hypothetical protein
MAFNATFNNIVAVSLIGGGNREYTEKTESTRRKPRVHGENHDLLQVTDKLYHISSTPCHERDSNLQL